MNRMLSIAFIAFLAGCSPAPEVLETKLPPVTRDAPPRIPELLVANIGVSDGLSPAGAVLLTKDESGIIVAGAIDHLRVPEAALVLLERGQCEDDQSRLARIRVAALPSGQWKHAERLETSSLLADFERANVRLLGPDGHPISECSALRAAAR